MVPKPRLWGKGPLYNEDRAAEYRSRINRVMDYIDQHLDRNFTLAELAGVACFSKFHFHRIFQTHVRETLFQYIQRVRLEKAAVTLVANPGLSITRIAYDCGFSSPAALVRAFRARFGMPPSQWRRTRKKVYARPGEATGSVDHGRGNPVSGPGPDRVRIRRLQPMTLAYVRYMGPYEGDAGLFARLFQTLTDWARPRGLVTETAGFLAVYHDSIDITNRCRLRVSAALTVPWDTRAQVRWRS